MPNKTFFHQNPKLLGLGKQIGQLSFGTFGKKSKSGWSGFELTTVILEGESTNHNTMDP